jgi:RNA polymerase sigma factor for flagellar operon FliA
MSDQGHNLMASYLGLVRALAWKIHQQLPRSVELDDLIGYGCIGLAEAAKSYDPSRGKFSTFAFYRIRGAIFDGLSQMAWFRRDKFEARAYQVSGLESEPVDAAELDAALNANSAWFRQSAGRLDGSFGGAGSAGRPDTVDRGASAEDAALRGEMEVRLRQLVDALPAAAAELLKATYYEGLTLKDAAARQGRNKSWASRLHTRVLRQLALSLKADGFA